ncbi:PRTRC system protein C [Azomonas macrocytogenes]|uniref:PRTRC genetic system protein C n=1 Tax=Azomonas macrocytogenes TaxID=69962 RepID=A0A839TAU8_AZOMA|nr:PRTRC system protein C [Azomonas macrocytogenes]MBB3105264.1 PRTRC genetic system protein C [Azomonas macrocytogenes]
MTAAIITLDRVFRYSDRDLPDPDSGMQPEAVLKHYARQFPRLVGAKIVAPIQEEDRYVYEFRKASFGDKG